MPPSSQQPARHPKYYIQDSLITFIVQGQLFRVHRHFFEWESEFFKALFTLPSDQSKEGTSDESPIPLPGVSIPEFEALLDYFYFRQSIRYTPLTRDHWTNLLSISSRYDFDDIREQSKREISGFSPPLEPVQMVVLALRHDVPEWLEPAYCALCTRPRPMNESEVNRVGTNIAVKISRARDVLHHSYPTVFNQQSSSLSPQNGRRRNQGEGIKLSDSQVRKVVKEIFWPSGPRT